MRVSIKDIAKAAGVSHSTVSRALSDSPLVAEATRHRIRRIAHKFGFSPNAIARGLVTRQTRAVGVVVTRITDPFAGEVVRGIEDIAVENGYRVFLTMSHADREREINLVKTLRESRVDGIIVAASRVGTLYKPLLTKIGVPIVLINSQQQGRYMHSVSVDNALGAETAARFLISQGHRVIAYLGGPNDHSSQHERLSGFRRALAQAHLPFDPSLVQTGTGQIDGGEQVARFLTRSPAPTAFCCYNDMTAIGALAALKRCGRRVPDDISLVGFDDIEFASYVDPPLTTIRQPKDEMGRLAMRMLLDLLQGKPITNIMVTGELIVRESTRPIVGAQSTVNSEH